MDEQNTSTNEPEQKEEQHITPTKTEEAVTKIKKEGEGFLKMLFDFSFSDFITVKIVKIIYGILIALAGLMALSFIIQGFWLSFGRGVIYLIISPFLFLLYIVMSRIWLELVLVIFKIAEYTKKIANK